GGAAPMKRSRRASLGSTFVPSGSDSAVPSPAASDMVPAGRSYAAQCQKPEPVGASGSKQEIAMLLVSAGGCDHSSAGCLSSPPRPDDQANSGNAPPASKSGLRSSSGAT